MSRIERYVLRTATTAFVSGLIVLTGVIWITQVLRQIDLLTSKGQTILIFLLMTGLALPSLVAIIAPVALFAGVLYTLNKLNGDSELVVMAAAGVSPGRLLRPLALLSAVVFAIVGAIYIQVLPWTFGAIENLTTYIRADFISNFARPGAFSNLELGFVFHYRERTPTAPSAASSCRIAEIRLTFRPTSRKPEKRLRRTVKVTSSCRRASDRGRNRPAI